MALVGATMMEVNDWETLQAVPSDLLNWAGTQLGPSMLPPYFRRSTTSPLLDILDEGHYDVALSHEEMEKPACRIDLVIPCCGDCVEANLRSDEESARCGHFAAKRRRMQERERENIEALVAD